MREGRFQVVKMDSVSNQQLPSSKIHVSVCRPLTFNTLSCYQRAIVDILPQLSEIH